MTNSLLISAAIAAIKNNESDDAVNDAFARACKWEEEVCCGGSKYSSVSNNEYLEWTTWVNPSTKESAVRPPYCRDLQAVLDEVPEGCTPEIMPIWGENRSHKFCAAIYGYDETQLGNAKEVSLHRALMLAILRAKLQQ